jgi:hypothetical protein
VTLLNALALRCPLVWITGSVFLALDRPWIAWPLWVVGVGGQSVLGVLLIGSWWTLVGSLFPVAQAAVIWWAPHVRLLYDLRQEIRRSGMGL